MFEPGERQQRTIETDELRGMQRTIETSATKNGSACRVSDRKRGRHAEHGEQLHETLGHATQRKPRVLMRSRRESVTGQIGCDDSEERRELGENIAERMRRRPSAMHEQTHRTLAGILHVPSKTRRIDETTVLPVGPVDAFALPIRSPQTAHEISCCSTMCAMIRRLLMGLGATLALVTVVFFLGPVYSLDTRDASLDVPQQTEALERWLETSEQRYDDIIPGTEKHIRWAHADRRRTPLSVIYLHGYTATRQEVDPLCDELGEALGANVFYTRLAGHGRNPRAMGEVSGNDWLRDAREALEVGRVLGERVIVVGTSTGGTLALWLAERQESSPIVSLVLISPNLGPRARSSELLIGPWGAELLKLLQGEEYRWTPHNAEQAKYWTWQYPSRALLPMMALVRVVRESPIENIRTPTLVIYSPNDRVVNTQEILKAHARLGSTVKPLIAVENSGDPSNHVLAGRILSPNETPRLREQILEFVRALPEVTDTS